MPAVERGLGAHAARQLAGIFKNSCKNCKTPATTRLNATLEPCRVARETDSVTPVT